MDDSASIRIPAVLVVIAAVVAAGNQFFGALPGPVLWDLGSFIASAEAAKQGQNPYGIYPLTYHVVLPGFDVWNPNLNPPISALLFQPLTWAEPHTIFRIWYVTNVVLHAATVILLVRKYGREVPPLVFALWAFALAGFWDALALGQIYQPLTLAATLAWLLLQQSREQGFGLVSKTT